MSADLTWFKSSHSGAEGGACIEVALDWRKSSYSGSQGGECIEVAMEWRKSSHSGDAGGECIEVATSPRTIHVRDSKDPQGPALAFTPEAWTSFLAAAPQMG
ncbi:DUF397 domain-containing protein [Streptantibioticus ferralitis]|uniref:DUF397 domain-containing protein n=1 Tax=Streptantibioticus ferralitis TaxID=236510 RepID=A0ABT5Z3T5_9ACTN|nr:DUF397 domain-containing protein [Streptantibioticus ferralitis]MDF2258486.1 DUF397 domain-containing protein [Streptantibioticus ferralitis]